LRVIQLNSYEGLNYEVHQLKCINKNSMLDRYCWRKKVRLSLQHCNSMLVFITNHTNQLVIDERIHREVQ